MRKASAQQLAPDWDTALITRDASILLLHIIGLFIDHSRHHGENELLLKASPYPTLPLMEDKHISSRSSP